MKVGDGEGGGANEGGRNCWGTCIFLLAVHG